MTYSVIREDGVRVEGLTKEQVYELIQGTTGKVPAGVDEGFITKLKEQRAQADVSIWVGSNAEYNALETKDDNVLYVVTDDPFFQELDERMKAIEDSIATIDPTLRTMMDQKTAEIDEWMQAIDEAMS